MDLDLRFRVPPPLRVVLLSVIVIVLLGPVVLAVDEGGDDSAELCSGDLRGILPRPYNNMPNVVCKPIWNSFVLRYSQTKDNVMTIVLSAIYTTGWVGMGFSKDGMMLNASTMVGWITERGLPKIKQYYVKGFTPSEIIPDKGDLPLTSIAPVVALQGATIYLAFQLKFATPLTNQPILLAFASKYPEHHRLTHHDDKTTVRFDFSAGNVDSVVAAPGSFGSAKKTHGMLGLFGWGLILPWGAIIARYLKHRDPLWYYLHVVIQFVGFIIGLAGVVCGVSLYQRLRANVPTHRGLGIFVLMLSILQVLAFFLRPNKDSKKRRYWNWYHHWVGRIALFFGAVNIVLGIQVGDAGSGWKLGYGFILCTVLLSCIVLEALSMLKRSEMSTPPPAFQMNTLH